MANANIRKIILDCLGGDNGMGATIAGAINFLHKEKDMILVMLGDRDVIKPKLRDANAKGNIMNRVEIVHTTENIPVNEHPTEAIKNHPTSSICLGLELLKRDPECIAFVSAGSTGAVLTGGFLKIGRVEGLIRPALCPNLPTQTGVPAMLIDCGANADCKPETMAHFALIGKVYKEAEGMMLPQVGLLNIGAEETKGSQLYQQTHQLLKKMGESNLISFAGNVEARDVLSGKFQIIVADGFAGNVLLKAIEGATIFTFGQIKSVFTTGGLGGKLAGGLVGGKLSALKQKFSGNEGGSVFLGLKKPIIKCHGNADARTITSALQYALTIVNMDLGEKIKNAVARAEPYLTSALQNLPMPDPIQPDEIITQAPAAAATPAPTATATTPVTPPVASATTPAPATPTATTTPPVTQAATPATTPAPAPAKPATTPAPATPAAKPTTPPAPATTATTTPTAPAKPATTTPAPAPAKPAATPAPATTTATPPAQPTTPPTPATPTTTTAKPAATATTATPTPTTTPATTPPATPPPAPAQPTTSAAKPATTPAPATAAPTTPATVTKPATPTTTTAKPAATATTATAPAKPAATATTTPAPTATQAAPAKPQ